MGNINVNVTSERYSQLAVPRLSYTGRKLDTNQAAFAKRFMDIMGASVLLFFSAPLLLICYLLVRFSSEGPALYDGKRTGRGSKPFRCYKFRTMHLDADKRLRDLLHDESLRREYQTYRKLRRDPRVTRVGKFLRYSSLDELPQLFNVLKGEMSLVGPRPYLLSEQPLMGGYGQTILQIKPGLTGYWQVSGRSEVSFEKRLAMEARYARRWTLGWDAQLLLKTVKVVWTSKGAS